jgi:hypothetical protein
MWIQSLLATRMNRHEFAADRDAATFQGLHPLKTPPGMADIVKRKRPRLTAQRSSEAVRSHV